MHEKICLALLTEFDKFLFQILAHGKPCTALAEWGCCVYHMAAPLKCQRVRPFGDNHLLSMGFDIWKVDDQQALARLSGPSACRMFVGNHFSGESHGGEGHLLDK